MRGYGGGTQAGGYEDELGGLGAEQLEAKLKTELQNLEVKKRAHMDAMEEIGKYVGHGGEPGDLNDDNIEVLQRVLQKQKDHLRAAERVAQLTRNLSKRENTMDFKVSSPTAIRMGQSLSPTMSPSPHIPTLPDHSPGPAGDMAMTSIRSSGTQIRSGRPSHAASPRDDEQYNMASGGGGNQYAINVTETPDPLQQSRMLEQQNADERDKLAKLQSVMQAQHSEVEQLQSRKTAMEEKRKREARLTEENLAEFDDGFEERYENGTPSELEAALKEQTAILRETQREHMMVSENVAKLKRHLNQRELGLTNRHNQIQDLDGKLEGEQANLRAKQQKHLRQAERVAKLKRQLERHGRGLLKRQQKIDDLQRQREEEAQKKRQQDELEAAGNENRMTADNLERLKQQLDADWKRFREQMKQFEEEKARFDKEKAELDQERHVLKALKEVLKKEKAQLEQERRDLGIHKAELDRHLAEIQKQQAELDRLKEEYRTKIASLGAARPLQERRTAESKPDVSQNALRAAQQELEAMKQRMAEQQRQFEAERQRLQNEANANANQNQGGGAELEQARREMERLNAERQRMLAENEALRRQKEELARKAQELQRQQAELDRRRQEMEHGGGNKLKTQLQKVAEIKIALKNKELELQNQEMNLRNLQRQIGEQRLRLEQEEIAFCKAKAALQMKHIALNKDHRYVRDQMANTNNLDREKEKLRRQHLFNVQEKRRIYKEHNNAYRDLQRQRQQLDSYRYKLEDMHGKLRRKDRRVGTSGERDYTTKGSRSGSRSSSAYGYTTKRERYR